MERRKVYEILLWSVGELLIILLFLNFGKTEKREILVLNICVSTLIYVVLSDSIFPYINTNDKSKKQVGSLGSKWLFSTFYSIFAIGIMIFLNTGIREIEFSGQILIHSILVFLLLCGSILSKNISDKVSEVYIVESINRSRVDEIKRSLKDIKFKLKEIKDVPPEIIFSIDHLYENMRYISPNNRIELFEIETKLLEHIKNTKDCFLTVDLNWDVIINSIRKCEMTQKALKIVYSN